MKAQNNVNSALNEGLGNFRAYYLNFWDFQIKKQGRTFDTLLHLW